MEILEPDLGRVIAPNPSPYTAEGTNTWILGRTDLCVIDPGPEDARHLEAVLAAIGTRQVSAIVVTHAHRDHSGLAPALSARTSAPVLAFGDARAGWRPVPSSVGGERGVDWDFRPDRLLGDGEEFGTAGWRLTTRHTPGHMGNHICLDDGRRLFTGDHAMGFATSLVSPPEGDMGDYIESLRRLKRLGPRTLLPGHGAPVCDGQERIRSLLEHRRVREAEVLAAMADGAASAAAVAQAIYRREPPGLQAAARRNVLAHLIDLERRGLVAAEGPLSETVAFRRL